VGAEAAAGGAAGSGRRRGRVLVRSGRARRGLAPRSYVALGSWLCGWLGLERTCGPARRCNGSRSRYGAATGPVSSTCSSGTASRCGVSGWRNTGPGNVRSDCVRWWYELVLLHCLLYAVYAHVRGQRKCQLYPRVSAATVAHYVQVQPLSCQRTFAFFEQSVCLTSPSLFPHLLFPSVSRVSKMIGTFC
jgi:hypothetical protein